MQVCGVFFQLVSFAGIYFGDGYGEEGVAGSFCLVPFARCLVLEGGEDRVVIRWCVPDVDRYGAGGNVWGVHFDHVVQYNGGCFLVPR